MPPLTMNILYVVEDGPTVTVIGTDHATGDQVAVTVGVFQGQGGGEYVRLSLTETFAVDRTAGATEVKPAAPSRHLSVGGWLAVREGDLKAELGRVEVERHSEVIHEELWFGREYRGARGRG